MNYELGNPKNAGKRAGFTLIEIIVVITIVAALASFGLWIGMDSYRGYSYRSQRDAFISALQKARLESMVNMNEVQHGVHIFSDRYTIFQVGNSAFDREIIPGGNIVIASTDFTIPGDIIFEQLSGEPSVVGKLTFGDGVKTTEISINNEGQISW